MLAVGRGATETVAVYGDAPYGTAPTDAAQFHGMRSSTRQRGPRRSGILHVGDVRSGEQDCTRAVRRVDLDLWKRFRSGWVHAGRQQWSNYRQVAEGRRVGRRGGLDYVKDADNNNSGWTTPAAIPIADLRTWSAQSVADGCARVTLGSAREKSCCSGFVGAADDGTTQGRPVSRERLRPGRTLFVTLDVPGGSNNDNDIWYGARRRAWPRSRRSPTAPAAEPVAGSTWRS